MPAFAQRAVEAAKRDFQIELDYSEASIRSLEEVAGRMFSQKPSGAQLEQLCFLYGAYLGEVARRHHGGDWVIPTDGPYAGVVTLQTKGGSQTSPSAKLYKRLTNGDEDNLDFYYKVLFQREQVKSLDGQPLTK